VDLRHRSAALLGVREEELDRQLCAGGLRIDLFPRRDSRGTSGDYWRAPYRLGQSGLPSSGLYLVKNIIDSGKATFNDFLNGFTVYLWELIGIAFILWIPCGSRRWSGFRPQRRCFILLQIGFTSSQPVPEFIYQTRVSNLELIGASYNFTVENWLEWLVPNCILTVAGYALLNLLDVMVIGLPGFVQSLIVSFAFGLCLTYFMAFRGFLFAELHGTTRRSRIYRFDARA
jgi:hypothetical protein